MSTETQIATERSVPPLGGFNLTFLGMEIRRVLRNRRTLIFIFVLPVVIYLSFGKGATLIAGSSITYQQYEMVSLALYGALMACTSGGSMVAVERALGWSRQLRLTPLRPPAYIAIKIMVALSLGIVPVVLLFAIGAARGVSMPAHVWILSGLAIWFGSLVFAALGLFVGYLLPSENVMQFLGPILGILSIFGGVFFPVSIMGGTMATIAKFTPVYGVGELARAPLTGQFEWSSVANIIGWLALFSIGSILAFRRDTNRV
jgi:ABC-2 type transport system permease protein